VSCTLRIDPFLFLFVLLAVHVWNLSNRQFCLLCPMVVFCYQSGDCSTCSLFLVSWVWVSFSALIQFVDGWELFFVPHAHLRVGCGGLEVFRPGSHPFPSFSASDLVGGPPPLCRFFLVARFHHLPTPFRGRKTFCFFNGPAPCSLSVLPPPRDSVRVFSSLFPEILCSAP